MMKSNLRHFTLKDKAGDILYFSYCPTKNKLLIYPVNMC